MRYIAVNNWLAILWLIPETNSQKKDTQCIPPLKRRNGSGLAESALEQANENGCVQQK